ncbi:hypothetical protein JXM83_00975 [Candidatus Woesearchaeota archaeon]|nr:hypothetical protein [Candidatus Woesearchaeota archaeon]
MVVFARNRIFALFLIVFLIDVVAMFIFSGNDNFIFLDSKKEYDNYTEFYFSYVKNYPVMCNISVFYFNDTISYIDNFTLDVAAKSNFLVVMNKSIKFSSVLMNYTCS